MKWVCQLVRNGNSIQLTMKRPMLYALGWLPNQIVVCEMQIDGSLLVRALRKSDYEPNSVHTPAHRVPAPEKA